MSILRLGSFEANHEEPQEKGFLQCLTTCENVWIANPLTIGGLKWMLRQDRTLNISLPIN